MRAADQDFSAPQPDDPVSAWLRPIVFRALRHEHILTLAQLHAYIALRGRRWYLPVPRLGAGKARAIERWLQTHAATLGPLAVVDDTPQTASVELGSDAERILVPLEQVGRIVAALDGSAGRNRAPGFCLIAARHDLEAIHAYLYRFRDRDKTARSYQKELERFLLWCVGVRRTALSNVDADDCERYKDFLAQPDRPQGAAHVGTLAPLRGRAPGGIAALCGDGPARFFYLAGGRALPRRQPVAAGPGSGDGAPGSANRGREGLARAAVENTHGARWHPRPALREVAGVVAGGATDREGRRRAGRAVPPGARGGAAVGV